MSTVPQPNLKSSERSNACLLSDQTRGTDFAGNAVAKSKLLNAFKPTSCSFTMTMKKTQTLHLQRPVPLRSSFLQLLSASSKAHCFAGPCPPRRSVRPIKSCRSLPYVRAKYLVPVKHRKTRLTTSRCASPGLSRNCERVYTTNVMSGRVATDTYM